MSIKRNHTTKYFDMQWPLLIALGLSFILVYFPVWKGLVLTWYRSDDYSHGFFIIPIVIYSLWQKREELVRLPVHSSRFGLVLLIISLILYIFAFYAEIKTGVSLAMIVTIVSVVLFFFGFALFREILFILLFLLFMIPVPDQIYAAMTTPLQLVVSQVSVWFVMVLGLPIFREGNIIHLPEHTLEMVQACSGLRSLMSLLTLSVVIAYFTLRSNWLRVILLFSAIPAAIIVNIIRIMIMILAFYYFDLDLTQGTVHTVFGTIVFILAIILVILVRGALSFWDRSVIEKL
ncbi:exosortase/archaeosortase family protein [Desulfocastanea catecholica]